MVDDVAPLPEPVFVPPKRPGGTRRRWLKWLLIICSPALVLLALLLLLGLFLVFEHVRGSIALSRFQKTLRQQGHVVSPNDLIRTNAGSNGAPALMQAITSLQEGVVLPKYPPRRMALAASGRAIVGFREPLWVEESYSELGISAGKITNTWDQLAADLELNASALEKARAALAQPVFDNSLDYAAGPKASLTHLAPLKTLSYWLGGGVQLNLHDEKNPAALEYLLAQIRLPQVLSQDQLLISELVRIALASIARTYTWEALQANGWTHADLASMQQTWETQSFLTNLVRSLEGERVFSNVTWELMKKSNKETASFLFVWEDMTEGSPPWRDTVEALPFGEDLAGFLRDEVYCRAWRLAWMDQAQLRYLSQLQRLIDLARQVAERKSAIALQRQIDLLLEESQPKGIYDQLRFPGLLSVATMARSVNRAARMETERSLVLAAIALERFHLENKALPPTLEALVPKYLSAVPIDYMNGEPLRYLPDPDGTYLLYSVGENGLDEQGDNSTMPNRGSSRQLWNRKDHVWPQPAPPGADDA